MNAILVGLMAMALAVDTGCSADRQPGPAMTIASPTRSASEHPPTRPRHARVVFLAAGEPARRLRQAERDLKEVSLWNDLTAHLYEVKVAMRPGRSDIPTDRHLADAYPSAVAAPGGYGNLCDITFYPAAITADLDRWRRYHSEGVMPEIPPATLRQYWGSILAHELAHCLGHGKGEVVARRWERRALQALRGLHRRQQT
ncbi:MAG: hypothetical protein M3P18_14075 [Actinomycetota bacterium]|nr:hypothetical protein [Actinomycetota bacterium]